MEEKRIWHISNNFLKLKPQEVLRAILSDDKANYERAEKDLKIEITLLDSAVTLYIEVLQTAYRLLDKWKDKASFQAAMAMAESALNYILLVRHSILLGYHSEAQILFRSCYERFTRCILFFLDENQAKKFLSGKQIEQKDVDRKLTNKLEEEDERKELLGGLRDYYGHLSGLLHPNLESFEFRYGKEKIEERVGKEPTFGGFMYLVLGRAVIVRTLQSVLLGLRSLGLMFREESGKWDKDYQRISASTKELLTKLSNDTHETT